MPLFTRTLGLLRRTGYPRVMSKAGVVNKPAKYPLTGVEQGIGLTTLFLGFMIPSGWILSHLDDYKHKSE